MHLKIKLWVFLLMIGGITGLRGQEVQWLSFEALNDSLRAAPKPVLIFIHTDWCKYCLLQEHNTFGDTTIIRRLNADFYAIRLNAETTGSINFLNRKYEGGKERYHELAQLLGRAEEQLVFPTTVILSQRLQLQHRVSGLVTAPELQALLE